MAELMDDARARVGRTLCAKWHLDALLDVGGMAAVYAATHRNGLRGAVKIPHGANPVGMERFQREGYIANQVDHPGAVRVLDDDVDEVGQPFLVMELLEGGSLYERAGRHGGKLGAEEVMRVTDELLDLLAIAHARGVIHRDIKPENVFLTKAGRVKLLDFGIARLEEADAGWRTTTIDGTTMGTPAFMSPEQARGRWDLVAGPSDLWSLGATMFTLLSGHFVHDEETAAETLAATFTKPARPLASVVRHVDPRLAAVVDRALCRSLVDRWQDADAMRLALREAYQAMFGRELPSKSMFRAPPRVETTLMAETLPTLAFPLSRRPRRARRARRPYLLASSVALFVLASLAAGLASAWKLREPRAAWQRDEGAPLVVAAANVATPLVHHVAVLEESAPETTPETTTAEDAGVPKAVAVTPVRARAPAPRRPEAAPRPSAPPAPLPARVSHRDIYDRQF